MLRLCHVCREAPPAGQKLKRCARCRGAVRYCGVACQRLDWPSHQADCALAPALAPPAAAASQTPFVLSAELVNGIKEAREFVADSLRGSRPWVVDLMDGKGLGALESRAKMLLLIELLKTRHSYSFKEVAVSVGAESIKGRFHLFEPRTEAPPSGVNFLALAYGLHCSGPVVVELLTSE